MTKKHQRIHKIRFDFLVPQIAIALAIIVLLYKLQVSGYIYLGIAMYFLLSFYLKVIIPRWHRKGLQYFKKKEFEGAAYCFRNSYNFFARYSWVDKYRAYTLLSMSAISYTEMALGNAAYCFRMAKKDKEAKQYEKLLKSQFPYSKLLTSNK
ncbi:MAG: hypothetical protein MI922_04050 [Bacteroidales bacterium]|nr:hypothetical protein [Bacteroidales bacterium]